MITTILAAIMWIASHLWALALIALPAILSFMQPILQAIASGASGFFSSFWEGLKTNKFENWLTVLVFMLVSGALGYHFGWQACIDWVHAHFRLVTKIPLSHWWKFW